MRHQVVNNRKYRLGKGKKFTVAPLTAFYLINNRCNNPKHPVYKDYGGRGIKCNWKNGGEFLKDMGETWEKGLTIDRIDNNGNYCKENCRWIGRKEQNNNRRNTPYITYKGKTLSLSYWADLLGVKYHTLYARIKIKKWPIEKAFIDYLKQK